MELKGTFISQKLNFPAIVYYKSPNLLRVEMAFQSLTFLQVSNDSLKWGYNPIEDKNTITPVDRTGGGDWKKENSSFDFINTDLLNYKELGHTIKLVGKDKMDSLEVFVLQLARDDKTKTKFFINTKNHLIYKVEDKKGYRYFANYSNTNGYVFPKYVFESSPAQQLEVHFKELSFNKTISGFSFYNT